MVRVVLAARCFAVFGSLRAARLGVGIGVAVLRIADICEQVSTTTVSNYNADLPGEKSSSNVHSASTFIDVVFLKTKESPTHTKKVVLIDVT